MGKTWYGAALAGAVLLGACSDMDVDVRADADPGYSVVDSEPMFVAMPPNPSIHDKRVLPFLRDEMVRSGFTVVDSIEQAKWIVVGTTESKSFPDTWSAPLGWSTDIDIAHKKVLYLVLYPAQADASKPPQLAWSGQISANDDEYQEAPNAVVHALLQYVGKNHEERDVSISQSYQGKIPKDNAP